MKGYHYQKLNYEIFERCRGKELRGISILLLIYLRGLAHAFQDPIFYWTDKQTIKDLSIDIKSLQKAKIALKKAGELYYEETKGRNARTDYLIFDTALADIETRDKSNKRGKYPTFLGKNPTFNNKSKNKNKKEVFERFNPNSEESLRAKKELQRALGV